MTLGNRFVDDGEWHMAISANPYAGFMGKAKPEAVIAETAHRISAFVKQLGPDGLERSYAPGKWSAREIICHLADTEIAFAFRLRQTLAEAQHVIQPFDQEAWSKNYSSISADQAVQTFSALRQWNLLLLKTVGTAALAKPVTHPERGPMTFQTLVETMAGHDGNHLRQLETIASGA